MTMQGTTGACYPDLVRKPVLVTGGGSGIGAAMVEAFALQGASTAFLEIDEAAAQRTAEPLRTQGFDVHYAIVDLRNVAALRSAVAGLKDRLGAFRVLINNAGDDERHAWQSVEPDYWDDRLAVNVRHQFFAAQAIAADMGAAGGGAIVNLGSVAWRFGAVDMIAYATAKAAIEGLTKSLARELGSSGIRVNCIAPGWILTNKQVARADATAPGKYAAYLDRQCVKEHLEPADVARLALWLASDEARRCSGQTFILDGGVV